MSFHGVVFSLIRCQRKNYHDKQPYDITTLKTIQINCKKNTDKLEFLCRYSYNNDKENDYYDKKIQC